MSQGVCSHSTLSAQTEMVFVLYKGAMAGAEVVQGVFPNCKFFVAKYDGSIRSAVLAMANSGIVTRALELGYPVLRLKTADARGKRRITLQVSEFTEQELDVVLSESQLLPTTDYLRDLDGRYWVFTKSRGNTPRNLTKLSASQRVYGKARASTDS